MDKCQYQLWLSNTECAAVVAMLQAQDGTNVFYYQTAANVINTLMYWQSLNITANVSS